MLVLVCGDVSCSGGGDDGEWREIVREKSRVSNLELWRKWEEYEF